MKSRYTLYAEDIDGKLAPYRKAHAGLPWEGGVFMIVDTREDKRIVARFDEGTTFPDNPLTQAWQELDRLNYAHVKTLADKVRKEYER